MSGLIAAAGFPPVDRPLHTWQHSQQETNRCSRGNACRQSQWDRLAEEERTPTVLSEGSCLLERNKPPSHSQQESPQQPISRFGISCCTSRCLGRIVSVLHLSGQPLICLNEQISRLERVLQGSLPVGMRCW